MTFAAIIPVFNPDNVVHDVISETARHVHTIIIVDDGSTSPYIPSLNDEKVILLRNETNQGYASAVKRGIERASEAGADCFVTLDGDGEHDPDDIPMFKTMLRAGYADLIIGNRYADTGVPSAKKAIAEAVSQHFEYMTGYKYFDPLCGFRAAHLPSIRKLSLGASGFGLCIELLAKASGRLRVGELPIATKISDNKAEGIVTRKELSDNLRAWEGVNEKLMNEVCCETWYKLKSGDAIDLRYDGCDVRFEPVDPTTYRVTLGA